MKYSSGTSGSTSSYWRGGGGGASSTAGAASFLLKCTDLPQFDALQAQADLFRSDDKLHLRNLCNDTARCAGLTAIHYSTTTEKSSLKNQNENNHAVSNQSLNALVVDSENGEETSKNAAHPLHQRVLHRRMILDYSRQRVVGETMELLFDLADAVGFADRREAFLQGHAINLTTSEHGQPVLHFLLRRPYEAELGNRDDAILSAKKNSNEMGTTHAPSSSFFNAKEVSLKAGSLSHMNQQLHDIMTVRRRILEFSTNIRNDTIKSINDAPFRNTLVVCSSRGGYQSGPDFISAALEQEPSAAAATKGRKLRFLASADPALVCRATHDLDPSETLVVVIWLNEGRDTTETVMNIKTVKKWLLQTLLKDGTSEEAILQKHFVAVMCENQIEKSAELLGFQLPRERVFHVWDWVNPRYSLCSAAGLLPLALHFSMGIMEQVLEGAHDMDEHFFHAPLRDNIPVILGLLGVWNSTFLGYSSRCILPYSDGLRLFPAHIQQVDMESNGKRVALDGTALLHRTSGEINVTTAPYIQQQSFFQLLQQGRVIPADFIGFMQCQTPIQLEEESVSNHDELMAHFFAEPDALAYGKTLVDLIQEGTAEPLREHMVMAGNRPSSSLLCTKLDAFCAGQLLALYEHRTAVQGFLWGLNSFDQFGIELGRSLATHVRAQLSASRKTGASVQGFNYSTSSLLEHYLDSSKKKTAGAS